MSYNIGQIVSRKEDECFPRILEDWLGENDAHLVFQSKEDAVVSYIITLDDETTRTEARISRLKTWLANTDYQAIKHSEGELTDEEYAPIKAQRQAWREEINRLENQ